MANQNPKRSVDCNRVHRSNRLRSLEAIAHNLSCFYKLGMKHSAPVHLWQSAYVLPENHLMTNHTFMYLSPATNGVCSSLPKDMRLSRFSYLMVQRGQAEKQNKRTTLSWPTVNTQKQFSAAVICFDHVWHIMQTLSFKISMNLAWTCSYAERPDKQSAVPIRAYWRLYHSRC